MPIYTAKKVQCKLTVSIRTCENKAMKNKSSLGSELNKVTDLQDLIDRFEIYINKLGKKELDLVITKLNFLCLHFDPYDQNPTIEVENILNEYELENFISNPFEFTNIVLQMLDRTDNLKKSRVQ